MFSQHPALNQNGIARPRVFKFATRFHLPRRAGVGMCPRQRTVWALACALAAVWASGSGSDSHSSDNSHHAPPTNHTDDDSGSSGSDMGWLEGFGWGAIRVVSLPLGAWLGVDFNFSFAQKARAAMMVFGAGALLSASPLGCLARPCTALPAVARAWARFTPWLPAHSSAVPSSRS